MLYEDGTIVLAEAQRASDDAMPRRRARLISWRPPPSSSTAADALTAGVMHYVCLRILRAARAGIRVPLTWRTPSLQGSSYSYGQPALALVVYVLFGLRALPGARAVCAEYPRHRQFPRQTRDGMDEVVVAESTA